MRFFNESSSQRMPSGHTSDEAKSVIAPLLNLRPEQIGTYLILSMDEEGISAASDQEKQESRGAIALAYLMNMLSYLEGEVTRLQQEISR